MKIGWTSERDGKEKRRKEGKKANTGKEKRNERKRGYE
jgi:hypothetical protein